MSDLDNPGREDDAHEMLQRIVDSVADPIFVKDERHRWILMNEAFCRLVGHSREVLMGKSDYDFFPKEQADVFWDKDDLVFKTGKENVNEELLTDALGDTRIISTKKQVFETNDGRKILVGVIRDVTDERRLMRSLEERNRQLAGEIERREAAESEMSRRTDALKRSNEALEQYAYAASHDLKEPLRTIRAYTELLVNRFGDRMNEEAEELAGFVVDSVGQLEEMVDGLLSLARIDTMPLHRERVDLDTLLDEALAKLRLEIEESEAVVTRDPLPTVSAHRALIGQVLQNLLDNAVKFRRGPGPKIHVSGKKLEDGAVRFFVQDDGLGLPPQDAGRAFRPFQRLHDRSQHKGVGLGLSLVARIVERHAGRAWMDTAPDRGTTVYVELPSGD